MNKEELIKRLEKYEWNDFECKKAQRGISEDTYKTVSAFANTKGGHLVFGIEDQNGKLEIVGVIDVDKVQNDFLSSLHLKPIVSQILTPEKIDLVSTDSDQVGNDAISNLVTHSDQVGALTDVQRSLLQLCGVPQRLSDLQENLGYSNRTYFKRNAVNPLINNGLLQMIKPDKPRAKDQKYVLTEGGLRLVQSWSKK